MSRVTWLVTLPACAFVLQILSAQEAFSADTDVSVSTNAGFTPYSLQTELVPGSQDSLFGTATSISGQHAAVLVQDNFSNTSGTLALFDTAIDGSTWSATDRAAISNGRSIAEGPMDYESCFSVASDGDNVVLAEPTLTLIESDQGQGGASFFRHSAPHWSFSGLLTDPNPEEGQFFACTVAISGSTAVIGAPWASPSAIFIAKSDGQSWSFVQKIVSPNDSPAYFGSPVAISGNRIVVGAPGYGYANGLDHSAAVFVLDQKNGSWTLSAKLVAQDMSPGDDFAHSVAVDHDTVVVGARAKNWNAGAIYIYRNDGGSWLLVKEIEEATTLGRDPNFGFALSMQNGRLLVGEPGLSRAHLFQQQGNDWLSRGSFSTENVETQFGISVAVSGREFIVGAPNIDNGRVYIFRDDDIFDSGFE